MLSLLAGCWLALGIGQPAGANADPPSGTSALEACQRQATSHKRFASLQLLDEDVKEESYGDKVGSQPISTVVSGHGIAQDDKGGKLDVRFTCLLDDAKKPVFVAIAEDGRRDPVDVCWDGFQAGEWGKMTDCLQDSLKREEAALAEALNKAAQQAEQSLDKLSAKKTLQEGNAQWIKYRDTECDRRQAAVAGRNHPDIGELTCRIHKTAERIADLRFDE
jgi:uncharacterized protein YecT (DUF1311 family)